MELLFIILSAMLVAMVLWLLGRMDSLIEQRDRLAQSVSSEHRAWHGCVGPITVTWDGVVLHARGSSDGRS